MEEEKHCGNCGHFREYHVKSLRRRWVGIRYGECSLMEGRQRKARRKGARAKPCEHWVPRAEWEAELHKRVQHELLGMADKVSKIAEVLEIE